MEISRNNFNGNLNCNQVKTSKRSMSDKTSFKGLDNFVVTTMDMIDRGGMAASFTIQDMLGTNIPRTLTALDRNREELGHPNYAHAYEVAIREFVTGPALFLVPGAILKLFTIKHKTGNVTVNTINGLSDLLSDSLKSIKDLKNEKNLNLKIYNDIFKNILENADYKGTDLDKKAKNFAETFEKALKLPKKGFFKKLLNKAQPGSKDDLLDKLANDISKIIKQNSDDASKDFTMLTFGKTNKFIQNIYKFFDELANYTNDLSSSIKKSNNLSNIQEFVNKFNKTRTGFRVFLNIFMTLGTMAVVSILPKLYMRNKENPAIAGLKHENINNITSSKEAINENK